MKRIKVLLPLIAAIFAVAGVFAMRSGKTNENAKATTLYFHYSPNTMSDALYETAASWIQSTPAEGSCDDDGITTCLVEVAASDLAPYSGTQEQKFADFLADQSSSSSYVSQNLDGTKSIQ